MSALLDFILHIDVHLVTLVDQFGGWSYAILFLIIFCETGLVFTPFLPGDSLLFVAGTLAGQGTLHVFILWAILVLASILGDSVNYWIGTRFGHVWKNSKTVRKDYLEKTESFYKKYGKKTIIIARFVPIVRTFAPFVAGMGRMNYRDFLTYNIVGGLTWVSFFIFAGYFFGQIPWVEHNLEIVILGIVFLSVLAPAIEILKSRKKSANS